MMHHQPSSIGDRSITETEVKEIKSIKTHNGGMTVGMRTTVADTHTEKQEYYKQPLIFPDDHYWFQVKRSKSAESDASINGLLLF
jgi:hypothetical protein